MKLLLGFSVEKFYISGMVLWIGEGKIKKTPEVTRHEVKSRVKRYEKIESPPDPRKDIIIDPGAGMSIVHTQ